MKDAVRFRVLALVGLAALGVGLALVGTAIGVGGPLADTGSDVEFTVSEDNVTLSNDRRTVTVVENMTGVETVEITEDDGQFRVRTGGSDSLTAAERDRAVAIARNNATVSQYLDRTNRYELGVELIERINASSGRRVTGDAGQNLSLDESGTATFTVENVTTADGDDSVTIDRDLSSAEQRVTVTVRRPADGELRYSITVDLADETVVEITDWGTP
ncbi:hypothetical protein [Halorussus sp. MSC15.2]|uniref:hypothetical protein n=1 Tax=Halorussus sp. MSC15.2 TaxID=2283638 RepID=UPI0013D522B8|nr:hypothetical protein [Halorussus sp. MSC15.2]NEU55674.1 hypothetical protein [Halorussus sp. MSC15.2]